MSNCVCVCTSQRGYGEYHSNYLGVVFDNIVLFYFIFSVVCCPAIHWRMRQAIWWTRKRLSLRFAYYSIVCCFSLRLTIVTIDTTHSTQNIHIYIIELMSFLWLVHFYDAFLWQRALGNRNTLCASVCQSALRRLEEKKTKQKIMKKNSLMLFTGPFTHFVCVPQVRVRDPYTHLHAKRTNGFWPPADVGDL